MRREGSGQASSTGKPYRNRLAMPCMPARALACHKAPGRPYSRPITRKRTPLHNQPLQLVART